jgi:hypothetical protein
MQTNRSLAGEVVGRIVDSFSAKFDVPRKVSWKSIIPVLDSPRVKDLLFAEVFRRQRDIAESMLAESIKNAREGVFIHGNNVTYPTTIESTSSNPSPSEPRTTGETHNPSEEGTTELELTCGTLIV